MNKKRKYITGIDGLRSIAVIGVILYHLTPRIMPGGFLGVTLFFVISGYLMTDILLEEWQKRKKIGLKSFYYKRVRRIYPSLLVMFVFTGSAFLFLSRDLLMNFKQIVLSSLLNVNNFWQILNGSSYFDRFGNESAFTHLWSLSIEGQFYLLWPIIVAFLLYKQETHHRLSHSILFSTVLSSVLMVAFYNPDTLNRLYYGTDTRIFSVLMGAYLAVFLRDYQEEVNEIKDHWKLLVFFVSIIGIIGSFIVLKDGSALVYQGGMIVFSLVSTLLLGSIITLEKANNLLTNSIFKWIGTRSYEIYLWQFPVMIAYEKMIKWDGSNSIIHLLIQFTLILCLSELTYRLVRFLRFNITYQKEWLFEALKKWQGKLIALVVFLLIGTFSFSLIVSPSGRTEASVALENKLNENKKMISSVEQEKKKEEKKVTQPSIEEKDTQNSFVVLNEKEKNTLKEINFTAIGDSLLLSAAPEVKDVFPKANIDAEVGRQLMDSEPVFKKLTKENKIGDVVLVVLGTNGSFTTKEMSDIMQYLSNKEVFFVNTMVQRPWQKAVNDELKKTAETYENAHLIDWKDYSEGMVEWFEEDDVHLTPDGALNFSNLLGKEIYDELKK